MEKKIFDVKEFARVARRAVAEGTVLLKNDKNALPIQAGANIALFGRSQFNYYKSGTGSGGMVNTSYVMGVREALLEDKRFTLNETLKATYDEWIKDHPFNTGSGWASEPWFQEEMEISAEFAAEVSKSADIAVILIGRTAGEDQDNSNTKGSYLLTDQEEEMIANVTKAFDKTVVLLNTGNIMDMSWVSKYNPEAVAYIWQGGQEGGLGALDVLSGDVAPSGRLTDTIACSVEDYPSDANFGGDKVNVQQEDIYVGYRYFETFAKDKVLYPFGFGLTYSEFDVAVKDFGAESVAEVDTDGKRAADFEENSIVVTVTITNTGSFKGQNSVLLYVSKPQGRLGNPARELVAFAKTKELMPGESQDLTMEVSSYQMSSYDDSGVTGHKSAYVMEEGEYVFYVGGDVRSAVRAGSYANEELVVVEQLSEALAPVESFDRMKPVALSNGEFEVSYEKVPTATITPDERRAANLPAERPNGEDKGLKLVDVYDNKCTMEEFVAQLSDEDLACIVRGEGMSSPKVTPGCGGAFGGVTDSLLAKGIPVGCCSDGPSGIRMDSGKKAFAMPNGTCLACAFNMELTEELYNWEGLELRKNKIDVLLGPGMNLHRHPLNGRNFEYFSEDPYVTGMNAAAQLRGMHKYNVTGTIKHFALNTQETGRHTVEHVASERAIREIYLKGFEIAVKEGGAHAVMTTYGSFNGYYTSSNYDLVTTVLRDEWGFEGVIMTDWWAKGGYTGQGEISNMAAIVRAQNDLYMVAFNALENSNNDNTMAALADGTLTRGELMKCAANICKFVMEKPVFNRYIERGNELDIELSGEADEEELAYDKIISCPIGDDGAGSVDPAVIDTKRNATNMIFVEIRERVNHKFTMEVRANAKSSLAQIPLSIFVDNKLSKMLTLTGDDTQWQTVEVDIPVPFINFFIKLYFAQDGMEIRNIRVAEE
ncbi:glycoside hydrolase family 3 protein [Butyrivibrio proteoclasticus]|uniref:glycoside hydrolase family 3 protein n=1 Tax=Butyrivibrio proteoclasticus TaxID=43305 RepID=UPI00047B4A20|nr:glycoside hydrolase family 3 protein [Butyrivibrio proteoclasticus]